MDKITIDDNNFLTCRYTPWDERAFNLLTNEIMEINYNNEKYLENLLKLYDDFSIFNKIKFSYTRIDSQDTLLRNTIQKKGFYYAETSYKVSLSKLKKIDFDSIIKTDLKLDIPTKEDIDQIKIISKNDFHYSRFHEDRNIDIDKARIRYYNWVDDLVNQKKMFLIYKHQNEVISFLIYDIYEDICNLILGGSKSDAGIMSYYFWSAFLKYFQKKEIKKINTIISASNLGILNLYSKFGFNFEKTLIGFHKLY